MLELEDRKPEGAAELRTVPFLMNKDRWKRVKFGDMAECITDRVDNPAEAGVDRYVGLDHLDPNTLSIRRWGLPTDVESTKLRFQPGDIIFGKRRAYQRKLAVADFEGICSAHAMVLRAREDVVFKDFLPVFMQSDIFFEKALAISVGSLSPTINWKTRAVQEFALPPKDEQRRIAEILWAAEEIISGLQAVFLSLRTLKKCILQEIGRSSRSSVNLGDLANFVTSGSRGWAEHYSSTGAIFLRVANLTRETIDVDLTDLQHVQPPSGSEGVRTRVSEGDVLISVTADLGRIAVVPSKYPSRIMFDLGPYSAGRARS